MDWVNFITSVTIDELISHLKCFRAAIKIAEKDAVARSGKVLILK